MRGIISAMKHVTIMPNANEKASKYVILFMPIGTKQPTGAHDQWRGATHQHDQPQPVAPVLPGSRTTLIYVEDSPSGISNWNLGLLWRLELEPWCFRRGPCGQAGE